jgi:hypothetical protein
MAIITRQAALWHLISELTRARRLIEEACANTERRLATVGQSVARDLREGTGTFGLRYEDPVIVDCLPHFLLAREDGVPSQPCMRPTAQAAALLTQMMVERTERMIDQPTLLASGLTDERVEHTHYI